jgi:hypothetical protein
MSDVALVTSHADAAAVERHRAELAATLAALVEDLASAAARGDAPATLAARNALVRWCGTDLLPHAAAHERATYPAACALPAGRLLVEGMLAEHRAIAGLVSEVAGTDSAVRAARALRKLLDSHLAKENDLTLLLVDLHELLGVPHDAPS